MRRLIAAAFATMLVAGCAQEEELRVSDGWVQLSPIPTNPAAVYFTLHGGETGGTLINVTTDRAVRADIHETARENGTMTMRPIRSIEVAADEEIKFAPGGRHVMLYKLNPGVKVGDRVPLIFTFANGLRIQYDAPVRAAGQPAPGGEG